MSVNRPAGVKAVVSAWVVLDRTCCGEHGDIKGIFVGADALDQAQAWADQVPTKESRAGRAHPVSVERFEVWTV